MEEKKEELTFGMILENCPIKGHENELMKIIRYMRLGLPVLIYGPPGNGKTTMARYVLGVLGKEFLEFEATEGTSEYHLVGGYHPLSLSGRLDAKLYKEGVVTRALKQNKNLLIDEFTRAPTSAYSGLFMLLSLGSLPLEHEEVVVTKPEGWLVVATANIGDEGTYKISSALKRRFMPIYLGYPDTEVEKKVVMEKSGLDEQKISYIMEFASLTRNAAEVEKTLQQGLSTDSEIKMALYIREALADGIDFESAFVDAAFQHSMIIADETDEIAISLVKDFALKVAEGIKSK
ncbi:MoxR family ATPase [Candidatus Parvarchaeota archaeon]|nr:MoxR family ATPase [Candidatus Parvarchaeota archaeon]